MKRKLRYGIVTLLTMVMLMNMSVFAAEPAQRQQAVAEDVTTVDVAVPEVAPQANSDEEGIMPLGIGGYAAKYTNPLSGSFTVDAPGDGNGNGTFQITTHDFPTSPIISAVLYRPDGSLAARILITGNGTKKATFSNAVPGTYKVVYSVESTYAGWISAWVSS